MRRALMTRCSSAAPKRDKAAASAVELVERLGVGGPGERLEAVAVPWGDQHPPARSWKPIRRLRSEVLSSADVHETASMRTNISMTTKHMITGRRAGAGRARTMALVSVALAAAWALGEARADGIDPPPADETCPRGTHGDSSHCGPHCDVSPCGDDGACEPGRVCDEVSLCIFTDLCETAYGGESDTYVVEACATGGTCASGSCQQLQACVPDDSPATDAGCGCQSVSTRTSAGAWLLLAAGLAGVVVVRRRLGSTR